MNLTNPLQSKIPEYLFQDELHLKTLLKEYLSSSLMKDVEGISEEQKSIAEESSQQFYDTEIPFSKIGDNVTKKPAFNTSRLSEDNRHYLLCTMKNHISRISTIDNKITEYHFKLNEIMEEILKLQRQRQETFTGFEVCRRLFSSVRLFTPEILLKIFYYATDERPTMQRNQPPFSLSFVSRSWRTAVLNSPQLWRTLAIYPSTYSRRVLDDPRILAAVFSFWFRNAGILPVSLSLSGRTLTPTDCSVILLAAVQHSPRISSLLLDLPSIHCLKPVVIRPFPLLSFLQIWTPDAQDLDDSITWSSSPHLIRLQAPSYLLKPLSIPLSQLTYLRLISGISPADWREIFLQCICLQHGTFLLDFTKPGPAYTPHRMPNMYACLLSLKLFVVGRAETSLFNQLRFPSLSALEIACWGCDSCFSLCSRDQLYREIIKAPLQQVILSRLSINDDDLVKFLSHGARSFMKKLALDVPNVDHEYFFHAWDSSAHVRLLLEEKGKLPIMPYFPHLQTLVIALPVQETSADGSLTRPTFSLSMLETFVDLFCFILHDFERCGRPLPQSLLTVYISEAFKAYEDRLEEELYAAFYEFGPEGIEWRHIIGNPVKGHYVKTAASDWNLLWWI